MSKGKALSLAAIALLFAALLMPVQFGCAAPFLGIALFYGAVAYYKHVRDVKIIHQAEQEQLAAPAPMVLPPMTTKGSNRLFVPPPLDRGK
jgi:hypothetical protein